MCRQWILSAALLLLSLIGLEAAEPALDRSTYDRYRQLILPTTAELRWQEIPWRLSFWQGLIDAQTSDRPLLLWIYGGSPAGVC